MSLCLRSRAAAQPPAPAFPARTSESESSVFKPERTVHQSCIHTSMWGRSCSTTTRRLRGDLWVVLPPRSTRASLKALYTLSRAWFSLIPEQWVTCQQSEPPGGQDDSSTDGYCPRQPHGGSPSPEARRAGGVHHFHAGQACPTVLHTRSTLTSHFPALPKQHSRARLELLSVGKCWCCLARYEKQHSSNDPSVL